MAQKKTSLPKEVFISHSGSDRVFVQRLVDTLRAHGIPLWHSPTNLIGAQEWHDEIGRALARCDWFLLVASPHAARSSWVKRELIYALNDRRYDGRVIPLLHKPCHLKELSWTFEGIQRIDFTTEFRAGCRDLLRIWGLGYSG